MRVVCYDLFMDVSQFTKNGKFLMLALDHRSSFKKLMNPQDPGSVTDQQATQLKKEIIDSIKDQFSALLIDQDWGLPAYTEKSKPFLLPIEKSGYEQSGDDRFTEIAVSIDDLKRVGASGAKLLVYFNPWGKTAKKQLETSKKVLDDCKQNNFPLFLEIRTYDHDGEADQMEEAEREKIVIQSLKDFVAAGILPDVYKLEYPGSIVACQTITTILDPSKTPWVLLTMADTFENFAKKLDEAVIRNCKGFLAGRALWQEVCKLQEEEKETFLKEILPQRFKRLTEIVNK